MNDECKLVKRQLSSSRKKYQEAIKSITDEHIKTNLRDKYFENRRNCHKVCRKQERTYWFKQKLNLNSFRSKDPKEFWNRLNMKPRGKSHNFSKAELSDYFKNLAKANESDEDSVIESENFANIFQDIDNILNRNFNLQEVKSMIDKLKTNKSAGIDTIISELLKNLDETTLMIILRILNKIFDSGEFPGEWAVGIIVILFKGSEKTDLNNYRGITLLSVIGKLLVGMLNERLTEFVEKFKIVNENQAGFRKGYRTTDHIFTLFSVINQTINVKKKSLYVCFIDFKKAFDKVYHVLLSVLENRRFCVADFATLSDERKSRSKIFPLFIWIKESCVRKFEGIERSKLLGISRQKLVNYGINGKFLNIIKSMCSKVKSCVRANDGLTEFFPYNKGLRQGCLLSLLLFALFLNDLNNFLLEQSTGITVWDIQIFAMLYADDLILLAESEHDLQKQK